MEPFPIEGARPVCPRCHWLNAVGARVCGDCALTLEAEPGRASAAAPSRRFGLRVLRGEREGTLFRLPSEGIIRVGRSQGQLLFPEDPTLDALQAVFTLGGGAVRLCAAPTASGVFRRLRAPQALVPGGMFSLGGHLLRYVGALPKAQPRIQGAPGMEPLQALEELLLGGVLGRRIARPGPRITVGRRGCDFSFPEDALLDAPHCELILGKEGALLRDLGSAEGTFAPLLPGETVALEEGDELRFGAQVLRCVLS